MTADVIRLPTAAPSYLAVRRARQRWIVALVTPCPGRDLATTLASADSFEAARAWASRTAPACSAPCV